MQESDPIDGPGSKKRNSKAGTVAKILIPVAILAASVVLMKGLAALYTPPVHKAVEERALKVSVIEAIPRDIPVTITGYGTVRSLDVVSIAPEIAGTITEIHPRLEVGELIPAGELLCRIDPRNYEAGVEQARAQVEQTRNMVARLKKQQALDTERLETMERSTEIAQSEFARVKELFNTHEVGTQSGVDQAEMGLNTSLDARDRMAQAVELYPISIREYPISIRESEAGLASAEAALALAEANLARTELRAPFDARVKMVRLEKGQFVAPGNAVMTLANDSQLELSVPLDSRDVQQWMRFEEQSDKSGSAWFGEVSPVDCKVSWTESGGSLHWVGRLNRVEAFDPATRTVTVAIRMDSDSATAGGGRLPVVDGMFCSVEIPGREMTNVFELPRWAVAFEGFVYVSEDGRLQRREVKVIRNQGEYAYVSEGLVAGDLVIVTRLVNPLPNTRLEIVSDAEEGVGRDDPEQAP